MRDRGRYPSVPFNQYSSNDVPVGLANSARSKIVLSPYSFSFGSFESLDSGVEE